MVSVVFSEPFSEYDLHNGVEITGTNVVVKLSVFSPLLSGHPASCISQ